MPRTLKELYRNSELEEVGLELILRLLAGTMKDKHQPYNNKHTGNNQTEIHPAFYILTNFVAKAVPETAVRIKTGRGGRQAGLKKR
jgi:hypothetical protein